jgi:AraC-like DNA-binding protein
VQPFRGTTLRTGPLIHIPSVLRELGCAPAPVMAETGFQPAFFGDPDVPIPYVAASKLIERCVAVSECDHFGLLVGMRGDPSLLGLVGFLLMNAPDVGTALGDLLRHLDLHDRGGVASLATRGTTSVLSFAIVEPDAEATDQIYDMAMALGCQIMRHLCGRQWHPTEVLLPRQRPSDSAPYTRFFRAPVRFDAAQAALAFPARWLGHRVAAANPRLRRHLEREANVQRSRGPANFVDAVFRTVSSTMAGGSSKAVDVAELLGMHVRTLNRRLKSHGTTFKVIRDDVRSEMARQLLGNTSITSNEIAATLGYAEASAFLRAFTRWSGSTPERWRRKQQTTRRNAGST